MASSPFPASITLTTAEALDLLAALEEAVLELEARGDLALAFTLDQQALLVRMLLVAGGDFPADDDGA